MSICWSYTVCCDTGKMPWSTLNSLHVKLSTTQSTNRAWCVSYITALNIILSKKSEITTESRTVKWILGWRKFFFFSRTQIKWYKWKIWYAIFYLVKKKAMLRLRSSQNKEHSAWWVKAIGKPDLFLFKLYILWSHCF